MTPAVFLVGPARSGTSLLYKALCLHPDAAWLSNYVRRAPAAPQLSALNRIAANTPEVRRAVWFGADSNAYVYNRARKFYERVYPQPVEAEPVFRHCGFPEYPWEPSAPTGTQAARLRRIAAAVCRYSGGTVLVSKRIAHNRRVPALLAALPTARFIATVRDGRAVAASLLRVDWWPDAVVPFYRGTPRRWAEEGHDPFELAARNWVEDLRELESGLLAVPANQVLRLSYEGFLSSPIEKLQELAGFAGLDPTDGRWLEEIRSLRFPNQNDAWRRSLDEAAVSTVERVQHDSLLRYGYAPVSGG